ncbi:MAG: AraC family transcriptional regulator [Fimbriimonadaceae bacterium]|nr:AraC family transcriptional regulator [Fimbriimonadaceae bacterium]
MTPLLAVPYASPPFVRMAWRSVHERPRRQSFRVDQSWGMHLYAYSATVRMDGEELVIRPGFAGFTPPGAEMAYSFQTRSVHVFAHLEWAEGVATRDCPAMFEVGDRFGELWAALESVMQWREGDPVRAAARAWDIQLTLMEVAGQTSPRLPPLVTQALQLIELRLGEPVGPLEIAHELGISRAHLARLFREHLDTTIIGRIRQQRMARARYLLETSSMPVKQIAAVVGIPDLAHFNKVVRGTFGCPPRALRSGR